MGIVVPLLFLRPCCGPPEKRTLGHDNCNNVTIDEENVDSVAAVRLVRVHDINSKIELTLSSVLSSTRRISRMLTRAWSIHTSSDLGKEASSRRGILEENIPCIFPMCINHPRGP